MVATGAVLTTAGVGLEQRDLARVGTLVLALPLLSLLCLLPRRPRLAVHRSLDATRMVVGTASPVHLVVRNDGWGTGALRVAEQAPAGVDVPRRFELAGLRRGQTTDLTQAVVPRRRGRFELGPLRVGMMEPLGLATVTRRTGPVTSLTAYPRVVPLTAGTGPGSDGDGNETGAITASGPSLAVRQYREGDDLRRVHWRSTARLGELMVRGEDHTAAPEAAVLLDSRRGAYPASKDNGSAPFEWAVSMAASVCAEFTNRGYRVVLSTQNTDGRASVADSDHLDVLAQLDSAPTDAPLAEPAETPATVIAVVGRLSRTDLSTLAGMPGRRLAFLLGDDGSAGAVLRQAGWHVVPVDGRPTPAQAWPGDAP